MNPSQSVLTRIPLTIDQKDFGKWDWGAEQWPAGIWNVRDTLNPQQPLQVMKASLNDRGIELHWDQIPAENKARCRRTLRIFCSIGHQRIPSFFASKGPAFGPLRHPME